MLGHGQCLFTTHEFTIHIHVHMYIHDDAGPVVVGRGRHLVGGGGGFSGGVAISSYPSLCTAVREC